MGKLHFHQKKILKRQKRSEYGWFHVKGPRKKVNVKKWIFFNEIWKIIGQIDDLDRFFKNSCNLGVFLAEQNRTEQNRTEQNRTEQNRTEQNRTEQNRTEQNRTEQRRLKISWMAWNDWQLMEMACSGCKLPNMSVCGW